MSGLTLAAVSSVDNAVDLSSSSVTLVVVVGAIAVVALAMGMIFRRQVLAAGEGTENMKSIALAVQEGASAYLTRMFRTLAVFAVLAFALLFVLPADDASIRIGRSIFFLVGAGFSAGIGYMGMWQPMPAERPAPTRKKMDRPIRMLASSDG